MPTRAQRAQQTRTAIIDAAVAVLRERGSAAVTISAIAKRAGVTSGAVYAHFSGKRAVTLAAMMRMVESLPGVQSPVPGATTAEVLRAMVLSGDIRGDLLVHTSGHEQDVQATQHESAKLLKAMSGLIELQNLLLARTLERLDGPGGHSFIHVAEAALLLLQGYNARMILGGNAPPITELAEALAVLAQLGPRPREVPPQAERASHFLSRGDSFIWHPPEHHDLVADSPFSRADAVSIGLAVRTSVNDLDQAFSWSRTLGQVDPDAKLLLVLDDLGDDEITPLARLQVTIIARAIRSAAPLHTQPDIVVVVDDAEGSFGASLGLELRSTLAAARVIDGQVHHRAVGESAPQGVFDA